MSDTMNIAADRDRRQRNGAKRGRDLYWGFTIAIFSNLVTHLSIRRMETYLH